MTSPKYNAPVVCKYRATRELSGIRITGPGVRMILMGHAEAVAYAIRDALSQAFHAGAKRKSK